MIRLTVLFICFTKCLSFGFFGSTANEQLEEGWVNPIDNFFGSSFSNTKGIVDPKPSTETDIDVKDIGDSTAEHSDLFKQKKSVDYKKQKSQDTSCTYLLRFVNILLNNSGLKNYYMKSGEDYKTVTVDISVTKKSLLALQRFSDGESVPYDELDESFVTFFKVFRKERYTSREESEDGSSITFFSMDKSQKLICLVFVICLVLLIWYFFIYGITITNIIILTTIFVYAICVSQNLWSQYEDIYAQRILSLEETLDKYGNVKIPDECYPAKLTVWYKFYYSCFPGDNPCTRYLNSKKNMVSELDIEKAFTKPIHHLILSFLPVFGNEAGKAVSMFSGYFSFPFNIIVALLVIYLSFSYLAHSIPKILSPERIFFKKKETGCISCSQPIQSPGIAPPAPAPAIVTCNINFPSSLKPSEAVPSTSSNPFVPTSFPSVRSSGSQIFNFSRIEPFTSSSTAETSKEFDGSLVQRKRFPSDRFGHGFKTNVVRKRKCLKSVQEC